MAKHDKYYGYTTAQNTDLLFARRMAYKTGDGDISRYPEISNSPDYEPTLDPSKASKDQLAKDTIERVYKRVMGQNWLDVQQMSDEWNKVHDALTGVSDYLTQQTDPLTNSWQSKASQAFLFRGPGASLKSIDDWAAAAKANASALQDLAGRIRQFRGEMTTMWQHYNDEISRFKTSFANQPQPMPHPTPTGSSSTSTPNPDEANQHQLFVQGLKAIEDKYAGQAQSLEHRMAQAYWEVAVPGLNGGSATVYEGPDNAVKADGSDFMPSFSLPGGGPGGAPGAPPPPVPRPPRPPALPPPPPVNTAGGPPPVGSPPVLPGSPPGLPGGGPGAGNQPGAVPNPSGLPSGAPGLGHLPGLPAVAPGVLGAPGGVPGGGLAGGTPGMPGGMSGPPMPPGAGARKPTNGKKRAGPGVVRRAGAPENLPGGPSGSPLSPPPGVPGSRRDPKAGQPPAIPGLVDTSQAFGGPSAATTPPVVGRPSERRDTATPGGPRAGGVQGSGTGTTPPGVTAPVLGGRRSDRRGTPVPPGGRRSPASTRPPSGTPAMDGSQWLDQTDTALPPPSAPVLTNRARTDPPSPVRSWTEEQTGEPGVPEATRPVIGRPAAARAEAEARRGGRTRQRALDRALAARRAREVPVAQDPALDTPLSDEQAFSVQTPGGAVVANAPDRPQGGEPKPTLGAS